MARTYIPTLVRMAYAMCVYIVKHRTTISEHLTEPQNAVFEQLAEACEAFTALVFIETED
jgi:hypothetical protein